MVRGHGTTERFTSWWPGSSEKVEEETKADIDPSDLLLPTRPHLLVFATFQ
jgi:hypothetical protein